MLFNFLQKNNISREKRSIQQIEKKYQKLCRKKSDINEHLPTLYKYATECESILETGVRGCVSSWALIYGLLNNNSEQKRILLNDINPCPITSLLSATETLNIQLDYIWQNNLQIDLQENYDLIFIDTWHVYGQLKRELKKFSKIANKYIIMHDTTVDGIDGETIRLKMNAKKQSFDTGIPEDEILKGLLPAIDEFLAKNSLWHLKEKYTNNNGLIILEKR